MDYPASASVETTDRIANWRPLVHWIMLIPHWVLNLVFICVSWLLTIPTMLVILFTGKLPAGLAGFQIMHIRHYQRMLAYLHLMHDQYPPFEFSTSSQDPGGTPMVVNIEAQLEDRNRLTALFRMIIGIPQIVFVFVYSYLVIAVVTIAYIIILFTGRWPAGMRNFVIGFYRAHTRYLAYIQLLNDKHPPFSGAA